MNPHIEEEKAVVDYVRAVRSGMSKRRAKTILNSRRQTIRRQAAEEQDARGMASITRPDGSSGARVNFRKHACPVCGTYEKITHFLNNPKCWRAIQRANRKAYKNLSRLDKTPPSITPHRLTCLDCGNDIYWIGNWAYQVEHCCAKCRRDYRRKTLAEAAHRYRQRNKPVRKPVACSWCGEKFLPMRSDAKYCRQVCRQNAYLRRMKAKSTQ